jgi:hypothetical protein
MRDEARYRPAGAHGVHGEPARSATASRRARRRRLLAGVLGACSLGAAAGTASVAGAAAGNGIASLPPAKALAAASAALQAQPRIILAGAVAQAGTSIRLDVESAAHGSDVAGTIVIKTFGKGFSGTVQVVVLPGSYYLEGGTAFWTYALSEEASLSAAERAHLVAALAGVWIELPAASGKQLTGELGDLTSPAKLGAALTNTSGTLTEGAPKLIGTTEALPIISSKGATIWVATTGAPLPLEITGSVASNIPGAASISGSAGGAGAASGKLIFSYPAKLAITPPKGAKTIAQIVAGG